MSNKEETAQRRRFRARPLRVDESVPVFYFHNKKEREENSELYAWLLSSEGKTEGQVQVVDPEGRPVVTEAWREMKRKGDGAIGVPGWRLISSEDSRKSKKRVTKPPSHTSASEEPFFRWTQKMPEDMEANKEYVMDDDDDDWLADKEFTEEGFESIMDALEKQHYRILLNDRRLMHQESEGTVGLAVPAPAVVLPIDKAISELKSFKESDVRAVYDYWVAKRTKKGRPLLERFWNEFPWSVILEHHRNRKPERVSAEGPFVGIATPEKVNQAPSKRNITLEEELQRLYGIREDLERARTLADQVRKREKLKKQLHDIQSERFALQVRGFIQSASTSGNDNPVEKVTRSTSKPNTPSRRSTPADSTRTANASKSSKMVEKKPPKSNNSTSGRKKGGGGPKGSADIRKRSRTQSTANSRRSSRTVSESFTPRVSRSNTAANTNTNSTPSTPRRKKQRTEPPQKSTKKDDGKKVVGKAKKTRKSGGNEDSVVGGSNKNNATSAQNTNKCTQKKTESRKRKAKPDDSESKGSRGSKNNKRGKKLNGGVKERAQMTAKKTREAKKKLENDKGVGKDKNGNAKKRGRAGGKDTASGDSMRKRLRK